jgi:lysozyme family protein
VHPVTINDLISGILEREGPNKPPYLDPNDNGGRTAWGMSERAHPELWQPGPPTRDQAFNTLKAVYVAPFLSLWSGGLDERIIACLVDDATMRGVPDTVKRFQHVLSETMDGVIGPKTRQAAVSWPPSRLLKAYVVERCVRLARIVQVDPTQAKWIAGWIARALTFLP